jgi:hypothetical protein
MEIASCLRVLVEKYWAYNLAIVDEVSELETGMAVVDCKLMHDQVLKRRIVHISLINRNNTRP